MSEARAKAASGRRRRPDPTAPLGPGAVWSRLAGALLAACAIWLTGSAHAQGTTLEYAVKANYLYKFAPFVEWPVQAFTSPSSPFHICVIGEDPFGSALDEAVRGQRIGDHPVAVRRLPAAERAGDCHVVFAGRSTAQNTSYLLRTMAGQPVLTVTDQSLGSSGGMIQFLVQKGRVRFAINAAAARASGLSIGSKLQQLAVSPGKAAR